MTRIVELVFLPLFGAFGRCENKQPNPVETIVQCNSLYADVLSMARAATPSVPTHNQSNRHWSSLLASFIKVNSTAAFQGSTGRGHVGIACRDVGGRLVAVTSFCFLAPSLIVAETYGLRAAMQFALSLNLKQVIFESDNKQLIDDSNHANMHKEVRGMIADIDSMIDKLIHCSFNWVSRQGNLVAHLIASLATRGELQGNWMDCPPAAIQQALRHDSANIDPRR